MRRYVFLFLLLLWLLPVTALNLKVQSLKEMPHDLSARTQLRKDVNGENCALLKVQLPLYDIQFRGNIVGTPEYRVNEYWVYMTKGSTDLVIQPPSGRELSVSFNNWSISKLESETTYNLVIDILDVTQAPLITEENGKPAVDLGLSVKWAAYNVGATSPSGTGKYYAWGETIEKKKYGWETYKYVKDQDGTPLKYNRTDGKCVLDVTDDVAHVKWGGHWRMPTFEEFKELVDNCIWENETVNNVRGIKATGPSGESIFFPAGGSMGPGNSPDYYGYQACYWTSSQNNESSNETEAELFNADINNNRDPNMYISASWKKNGNCIRAVCP